MWDDNKAFITGFLWDWIKQLYTNVYKAIIHGRIKGLRIGGVINSSGLSLWGLDSLLVHHPHSPTFHAPHACWRRPACVDCCPASALCALGPVCCKGLVNSPPDSVWPPGQALVPPPPSTDDRGHLAHVFMGSVISILIPGLPQNQIPEKPSSPFWRKALPAAVWAPD